MDIQKIFQLFHAGFQGRFLFLLLSLLSLMVLTPLLRDFTGIKAIIDVFLTAILVSGLYAISPRKRLSLIATLLAISMLASIWINHFMTIRALILVGYCSGILFMALMAVVILSHVAKARKITQDCIYGAVVVYLLIGLLWAFVYSIMEVLHPGSFSIVPDHSNQIETLLSLFVYYSFVTITTLGYGDITPVTGPAKSFSFLEAIIGQIYLAILVARLVGIQIAQSMGKNSGR